jgi:hypothetical protein
MRRSTVLSLPLQLVFLGVNNVNKVNVGKASGDSEVVEHSLHQPKVKGLSAGA